MKIKTIGATVVLTLLGMASGHAQNLPFSDDFVLTRGDLDAIGAVTTPILEDGNVPPGSAAKWKNDESGSSGSVKLVEILDIGPYQSCKKIQFDFEIAGAADPKRLVIEYCKVEDGTWKSYP